MSAISVQNLTKVYRIADKEPGLKGSLKALVRPQFKEKVAVDNLSFQIEPGEIVGYIGVNGAGKSTTIKMLTGILEPSGGKVSVMGRDPHRQRVANAREIGVVFGQRTQLWWDLALIESLNLIAKIYEIEPALYKQRLHEFTETLELGELLRQPIRSMSLGQKMRAELAATLIHDPKVVYLDEPTIGLDVVVKERIRAFIKERNRIAGTTVILTTHDLGDIEELCQRVIMIDAGQKIYDGPLAAIKERFGKYRTITLETAHAAPAGLALPEGVFIEGQEESKLVLRFDRTLTTASQVAAAVMAQAEVIDFNLAEPDLESIVKQIYSGALSTATPEVGSVV
ncbi:MAG TPA: ATP-binding cassette domain-containing protein [Symbiobacteriaceae bacterium]|nr:ATP-binding cassette domain-containing protein [Symbiobacteriaceae bacterium]